MFAADLTILFCPRLRVVGACIAFTVMGTLAVGAREARGAEASAANVDLYRSGRWEFSLESAYTFGTIPNPFASLANLDLSRPNRLNYRVATQLLAARYRLSNPWGPWLLRGSLQASATLVGTAVLHGPESYFAGVALGLRYDFVQPRAAAVPFVEMRSGPGTTDSSGIQNGQQQDFTFTYIVTAGLRYDCSERWSLSLAAFDQHMSNAYLAEKNWGFDSVGFSLGVFGRFWRCSRRRQT